MNLSVASFILLVSSGTSGARQLSSGSSSKSGKSSSSQKECQRILSDFNGQAQFGDGANAYTRTVCAGDTNLLTIPAKAYVINEKVCGKDGIKHLDELVAQADDVGGCKCPAGGQASEAMEQYRHCRDDAEVATDMVCTDPNTCWKVLYQLQNSTCWTEHYSAPDVAEGCLPVDDNFQFPVNEKGVEDETPYVTCKCLRAYVAAYEEMTKTGRKSLGMDEDTLEIVSTRIKKSCGEPL